MGGCGPVRAAWLRRRITLVLALWMVLAVGPAAAKAFVQRISQMGHAVWRTQDGEFSTPNAVVRTRDGYVWIGTTNGLVRFDGVRFVHWNDFGKLSIASWNIESMLATADGKLWIGTMNHVARISGRDILDHTVAGRPLRMVEDDAGAVWIAQTRLAPGNGPICRLRDGEVRCFGAPELPLPFTPTLAKLPGGGFWVGGSQALCKWTPGQPAACFLDALLKPYAGHLGVNILTPARDGIPWVGIGQAGLGLGRLVNGEWQAFRAPGFDGDQIVPSSLLEDRTGSLWVGTEAHGLYRIRGQSVDHFGVLDGLSSNSVTDLLEDSEGSIWAVTPRGLHQFRPLTVSRFSTAEGLERDGDDPVLPMRDGTVWIRTTPVSALSDGSFRVLPRPAVFDKRNGTAMTEDHRGRLWIGLDRTLNIYEGRRLLPVYHQGGTDLGVIARLVEDARHDVWALRFDQERWIYRIRGQSVIEAIEAAKLGTPQELAADPQGGLWLGYGNGDLASYRDGMLTRYPADDVSKARVQGLMVDHDGTVLAATSAGVLVQRDGIRRRLGKQAGLPCEVLRALVRDGRGTLWLNADCGYIGVAATELERWLIEPRAPVAYRLLDATSGAQSGGGTFAPTAGCGPDGRVWFASGRFAMMIDTDQAQQRAAAPPVVIEDVRADQVTLQATPGLRVPERTRDLEIRYTALSLISPGKTRFQYRLEGRDSAWHDAENRRQAIYTDLPPGRYRFRVKAANSEGVWNEAGAALDFELPAAYYQTRWFAALCFVGLAALIYGLVLLRLRQMSRRLREQLAVKTRERERIARDLHDTLLQSTQALILRFDAATRTLPAGHPVLCDIERALDDADEVMAEGRDRVLELRLTADTLEDLAQALATVGQGLAQRHGVKFLSVVDGSPRPLAPPVRDEAYRIGREALFNAFRHARARSIEVQLIYGDKDFRLRVRDDGEGIPTSTLEAGSRPGHWGLPGMRERAQQFGATLDIWSRPGAGTEIELTIQAARAYPGLARSAGVWHQLWRAAGVAS
jgi:signal transduction histidine kinase/ligand-binding sensor domain-containing protein